MADKQQLIGAETYEPGKPTASQNWRTKLGSRAEMLKYLQSGERYWYSKEWYGSEKRRTPA